jgi:hypothetical protein
VEIDTKTGLSHLTDVPRAVCELFQNRTDDGEAHARRYAAARGLDWDALDPRARSALLNRRVKATRRAKDGKTDFAAWLKTAADAGYRHRSVIRPDAVRRVAEPGEQIRVAYEASLPLLEQEWSRRATLEGSVPRIMAARGLIASGITSPADIEPVLDAYRTEGVRQDGRLTELLWAKDEGKRFDRVTTGLHLEQEEEAVSLLKAAAEDRSAALKPAQIEAALARVATRRGYNFTTPHGQQQRAMAIAFATAGRAVVGVGAAGSGKGVSLEPVLEAYHAAGWKSLGVTLAWRQTHGLVAAGAGAKRKRFP